MSGDDTTATLEELKDALKDALDSKGVLNQIKARVRAEIFSALDEQVQHCSEEGLMRWHPPAPSHPSQLRKQSGGSAFQGKPSTITPFSVNNM